MKTPLAGLRQQFDLSMRTYEGIARTAAAIQELRAAADQLRATREQAGSKPVADAAPTPQAAAAVLDSAATAAALEAQWQAVKTRDIPALNARLKGAGLPEITLK